MSYVFVANAFEYKVDEMRNEKQSEENDAFNKSDALLSRPKMKQCFVYFVVVVFFRILERVICIMEWIAFHSR